jgi:hypothetical protein
MEPAELPDYQPKRPEPAPDERTRRKRREEIKRRGKPVYETESRPERKLSATALITVSLALVGTLCYTASFGLCQSAEAEGYKLQNRLEQAREANIEEEAALAQSYDLERVRAIAAAKGMGKPLEHQKIYIDVPETDYFIAGAGK